MTTSTEERSRGRLPNTQVEHQLRFRAIVPRASARPDAVLDDQKRLGPFVTVSREMASGGADVARRVADRLGWAVLDRELVERLASDLELEPGVLGLLDETRATWFSETLLNLFNSRLVAQRSYVELVGKVVALAASAEPIVVVGRGAHLILPANRGVRVRIIAPTTTRVSWLVEAEHLEVASAERTIRNIDADRQSFIRRNFRCDPSDASLYDLVLNTESLGREGCVELIVQALVLRGLVDR